MISSFVMIVGMTAMAQAEPVTHRILNTTVRDKFYVSVRLSSGYETQIPVVNGYLPHIKSFKNNRGRVYRLDLDYAKGQAVKYDPNAHRGVIQFTRTTQPDPKPKPKPTPKPPITRPVVPVVPRTVPLRNDNREIDGLFDKLRTRNLEKQKKTRFVRPSDIGKPPKAITPNYKRP